ncbi:dnaJ homolog subfamily C member 24-like [Montipora capricornis]|uniref:dnaJ homolog subfamily C member 24-like n=1 Tax=Montipora capricornis TaxID=246305 RepID=UPI0035F1CAE3
MASGNCTKERELTNPYSILGVSTNSSYEEIKRAYQKLLLKFHPDKLDESLSQKDRDKACARFLAVDQAWKLLNNQGSRAKCDRRLQEQKLSQDWPVSAEVDLDDMEYHEDIRTFSSVCRCSGEYLISESDLENGQDTVCCSGCTLSIRVLYNELSEGTDDEDEEIVNRTNFR